jgi:thiosulfate dehydrogenase [quinone] large subunit
MQPVILKLFLRIALSAGFLSVVADRFGLWSPGNSVWGNWENFVQYTAVLNPWLPEILVSPAAISATVAEIVLPLFLLLGFKTELFARLSGYLLFVFALAMTFSTGVKGALDYSIFSASAAAFALSSIRQKYLEIDIYLK